MADERVFFEERVELRELRAPGQVRRRSAVPFLGDRPAFEPTHVRVTDRHVQVGDRTILLARVSEVDLEHAGLTRLPGSQVGCGGVLRLVAGAVVMFWLFYALHYDRWPWAQGAYWTKLGEPGSMCLGVGLSLAALLRLLGFAHIGRVLGDLSVFGLLFLAFSALGFAVGDDTAWVLFALWIPLLAIVIHVNVAEIRREVALFCKPTYALSITTGGTRTLTVESKERDVMNCLLEAIRRALLER